MRSRSRNSLALALIAPLAASLLFLGSWPRPATAQLLGPEFQVNTYTTSNQAYSAVAADGSGRFVVAWTSFGQDGPGTAVFGQSYDSAGNPVGSEFLVNTYAAGGQSRPAVAANGPGNFVVAWESYGQDGSGYGVFAQRFNSAGSPVGIEFQVSTYTTSNQRDPAVAADGSGNFVVVWSSYIQDGSYFGVFGQRFNSAGSKVGSEFQVNTYTTSTQSVPAVTADGSGNFVVVWNSVGQDGSGRGAFGQRFNSAGSRVGSEFQVNSYTTSNQEGTAVTADGSASFVVAWQSWGHDGSSWGVFGQRFNPAGKVGSEFQVNTYTTSFQSTPAVTADGSGNFVVVWQSSPQDGSGYGVFGQRFNWAGSKVGSEFRVNTYTAENQVFPAVAVDGSGNFVVAWDSLGQDGYGRGVFGRRLTVSVFQHDFDAIPPFWSDTTATMCSGFCGGPSPDGCWCDAFCLTQGDCCLDNCRTCGVCVP